MKLLSYARVSRDRQVVSGLGLESQRSLIKAYAETHGHEIIRYEVDEAVSGAKHERPALNRVLADLREGVADGLIVAKLDRLTRSLLHFAELMEVSRRQSWTIIALDMNFSTADPSGELLASMLAIFGQWERRRISTRIREALAVKRSRGERLGAVRKVTDEALREIHLLRSAGGSWRSVARALNELETATPGGGRWHPATAQKAYVRHWRQEVQP